MALLNLKVMLIGDKYVGKTSAIYRFCDGSFNDTQSNVACDIKVKKLNVDGEDVQLELWDTVGQEQHDAISKINYRNIKGVLLMYDVTSASSFKNLKKWIKDIDDNVSSNVAKVLIGNKCDVPDEEREVHFENGLQYAKELNIPFFEVSCKKNINIYDSFINLAKKSKEGLKIEEYEEKIRLLEIELEKAREAKCCIII